MSVAIGLTLALSSTAIVLQSLSERGLLKTEAGQNCFSVLLFQDIAVIPMLAVMPLLATLAVGGGDGHGHHSWVSDLAAWQHALVVVGVIGGIVVVGTFLTRPIFRFIAETGLREVFTAFALLLVIGIAMLMASIDLSPALGTFLAGVVLAESEYRHELESDIEPFKGLLLGLFFIAVGASIDFNLLREAPDTIAGIVAGLVIVKLTVLLILGRVFRMDAGQNFLFSFSLAQGGEFAFVLFSFATQNGILPTDVANPLVVAVALSMAVTPLLMILNEALIQPRFATTEATREADTIDEEHPVIIAGFGRFGHVVGRMLKANGVGTTVLDLDPEQIDVLRRFGMKVFYGDGGRIDLLHSAGAEDAKLFVLAIDDPDKASEVAREVRRHFPHLKILARAESLQHAYDLMEIGVDFVIRETFDSAVDLAAEALKAVGFRAFEAHRAARMFKHHETHTMAALFEAHQAGTDYMETARERITDLDELMQSDERGSGELVDHAWEPSSRPDS